MNDNIKIMNYIGKLYYFFFYFFYRQNKGD